MSKEKWIDEILQAKSSIQKVPANPFLATRIMQRLSAKSTVPKKWVYVAATVICLLLLLNIVAWRTTSNNDNGVQNIMREYGWSQEQSYSVNNSIR